MYYIHKHEVSQQYGGSEEGGWWYEVGVPVEDWEVLEFSDEEKASEKCRELNEAEHERAKKEEKYEYTSVLSHLSEHFGYSVEEVSIPEPYPKTRPHYE